MSRCGGRERPGCGEELLWGSLPDGRKVPLDLAAPVYRITGPFDPASGLYPIEKVEGGVKVSHSETCTHVRNFSSSTKPKLSQP